MDTDSFDQDLQVLFAHMARGDFDAAERLVEKALLHSPTDPNLYRAWGRILLSRNQIDDAVFAFKTAVSFGPNDHRAHFELSSALLRRATWENRFHNVHTFFAAEEAALCGLELSPGNQTGTELLDEITGQRARSLGIVDVRTVPARGRLRRMLRSSR